MNPESSSKARCPTCGDTLQTDAVEGICLKCLLDTGSGHDLLQRIPAIEDLAPFFPGLRLEAVLGAGGMGAVYRATQLSLDREIALKVLLPDQGKETFASRFLREAQALARLNHPNIVTIHDYGEVEDCCFYLVMEYVDGMDLDATVAMGSLDWEETRRIGLQICDALQYAHEQGVIHRDIKPANVLLREDGFVKLADFGLARLLDDDGGTRLTRTDASMGTPHFTAPEQFTAAGKVDQRADVYSLGAILYHLLVGGAPIGRFAVPSSKAGVSRQIDTLILRALEEEPDARFQTVAEMRSALDALEVTRATSKPRTLPWLGLAAAFAVGVLLTMLAMPRSAPSVGEGLRYSFDHDLRDVNGGQSRLIALGDTRLDESTLVFGKATDRAYAVFAAPALYDPVEHRGFELRLRARIDAFADGPSTVSLLKLEYRWDSFLGISHSHWLPNIEVLVAGPDKNDPNERLLTAAQADPIVTLGAWHTFRLVVDERGFQLWIDGKQIGERADSGAVSRWKASRNEGPEFDYDDLITLSVGSFVGAIDELAVIPLGSDS